MRVVLLALATAVCLWIQAYHLLVLKREVERLEVRLERAEFAIKERRNR